MRILLVNYEYPGVTTNCGGGGRVTQLLAEALRDRGHDVRVVTDAPDGHWSTFPVRSAPKLSRVIKDFQPDVVNGHFSLPSSLGLPLLVPDDTPLVISVMGADVYDPTRFGAIRAFANAANRWLFAEADRIITPSQDMARRIPRAVQRKHRVINYGTDTDRWDWRERERHEPLRVLTVCRLVERKNLGVACRATERLQDRGVDVTHRIVGTGPRGDALRERFDTEMHEFRGYVDGLQAEYDWADVFFLPSEHEAFGMVFLEALASGLPVATSPTGGQTDIVGPDVGTAASEVATDGGQSVSVAPPAYAHDLRRIAEDYDAYQRATEGYVSEQFSAAEMACEYEQTYQSVR